MTKVTLSNLCGFANKIRQRTCITFSCHLSLFSITFIPHNRFHSNALRHHVHTKKSDSNVPSYTGATDRSLMVCWNGGTWVFLLRASYCIPLQSPLVMSTNSMYLSVVFRHQRPFEQNGGGSVQLEGYIDLVDWWASFPWPQCNKTTNSWLY
jgi:hypothetical protein